MHGKHRANRTTPVEHRRRTAGQFQLRQQRVLSPRHQRRALGKTGKCSKTLDSSRNPAHSYWTLRWFFALQDRTRNLHLDEPEQSGRNGSATWAAGILLCSLPWTYPPPPFFSPQHFSMANSRGSALLDLASCSRGNKDIYLWE